MSVVLPGALAWVLDMTGVEWPDIDEDDLRSGATELRILASEVDGNAADGHLPQLSQGLKLIATGLDVSAGLVEGMKVGAVVQLGVLAGEIIADRAAAPFTFGASEAAIPAEVAATGRLVRAMFAQVAQQVEQALLNAVEDPIFSALGSAGDVGGVFSAGQRGPSSAVNGEIGSVVGIPA